MKKVSIVEAYVSLKNWVHTKFIKNSLMVQALSSIFTRIKQTPNSFYHFTPIKATKGLIGFIPVGLFAYYLGYSTANTVKFYEFTKYFTSEDEIFSILDSGKPVMTFMYLPGEVFSEVTHPHFHKTAYEYYQYKLNRSCGLYKSQLCGP